MLEMSKKPENESKHKKLCPQCGSEVNPDDEFCKCGKLLLFDEDYDATSVMKKTRKTNKP